MDPKGKIALITGAASGLGLSMTRELLKNGVRGVLMADVNQALGDEVSTNLSNEFKSAQIVFVKMDVAIDEEYEEAFKKAIDTFGQIDIVINNAGILDDMNFVRTMNINFGGVLRGTQLGLKYLGKDKLGNGGIIVNTSSITAVEYMQYFPIYAACKAGVLNLCKAFGDQLHYNRTGVRVVALCPSFTQSSLTNNCTMLDECAEAFLQKKTEVVYQKTDIIGQAALYIIKNAESASAWIVEHSKLFKFEMPKWQDCSTVVEQYDE